MGSYRSTLWLAHEIVGLDRKRNDCTVLRMSQTGPGWVSNRRKWTSLKGVNLLDGQTYQIAMLPRLNQDKVKPESFRILFRTYLTKPETKSLAPDGTLCMGTSQGLLQRATITAVRIVPVGKETDRRWEQGEDPSMIDSSVFTYEKMSKTVVADLAERKKTGGYRHPAIEERIKTQPSTDFQCHPRITH